MQKKGKSPWPFQEVLGFLRHFILLFGAYDSFRQNNVMPWATGDSQLSNSCLFSFYHYPQSRGITWLLDTLTRNVQISEDNVLSLSQLFDWFYLPHFLLLHWVVVKYKGVRSPCRFTLVHGVWLIINGTHTHHKTSPPHRTVAGAGERS
jgi:hypothetical protein